jgi:uncharacterized protein (TIGR01777 family)
LGQADELRYNVRYMRERPLRIVIPGGSGHLGSMLARHFHERDHSVTVLARRPLAAPWKVVLWDGSTLGSWATVLEGADIVINMAGRSVNCRYHARNRREILQSRIFSTQVIGQAIAEAASPPRVWLNASSAACYPHVFDRVMDEAGELGGNEPNAPRKWRFSVEVVRTWERTLEAAVTPQTRKVALRSAMVMSPAAGGAFDLLLRLVRCGMGGPAGSGRQYVSWIHDVDFIRVIEFLIDHDISGPINVTSPGPLTNREFMHCIREAWCPCYLSLPLPRLLLEAGALLIRTETELVLKSRRVIPGRLLQAGFDFHFPQWRGACHDLVERWRALRN